MPKGILGASIAENGDLEYPLPPPPPPPSRGFTFSVDFGFLENVEMDRAGREALETGPFSGENERASVAVDDDFL